jgi:anaerobic selenocysteine-containing dehydrogenase
MIMDILALKKLISRRSLLKGAPLAATAVSLGCMAPGQAAAQAKLSQVLSKYQDTPKGEQQCSNCSHFVAPASCAIVVDPIKPEGWCQFWAKP